MKKENLIIRIKVSPGCQKSEVVRWEEDILKIRVKAPPVKGAANHEAVSLLASFFELPKRDVTLIGGATSGIKRFLISGLGEELFQKKINQLFNQKK